MLDVATVDRCLLRSAGHGQDVTVQGAGAEAGHSAVEPLQLRSAHRDQQPQPLLQVVLGGAGRVPLQSDVDLVDAAEQAFVVFLS